MSGQMSTVTASITRNSNNQTGFTVPNVTPVSFSAVRGTMNPDQQHAHERDAQFHFTGTQRGSGQRHRHGR